MKISIFKAGDKKDPSNYIQKIFVSIKIFERPFMTAILSYYKLMLKQIRKSVFNKKALYTAKTMNLLTSDELLSNDRRGNLIYRRRSVEMFYGCEIPTPKGFKPAN